MTCKTEKVFILASQISRLKWEKAPKVLKLIREFVEWDLEQVKVAMGNGKCSMGKGQRSVGASK